MDGDPNTSAVYCLQSRPKNQGHGVLVLVGKNGDIYPKTQWRDLTDPKDWDVRTGVYDYGGTAAAVFGGTAYFSNVSLKGNTDGRVYKVLDGKNPTAITRGKSL